MKIKMAVIAAVAAAAASSSWAQDQAASGSGTLEEITVTAQRRAQSLQDVPIALTAYTAEQLEQRQIVDTYDIVRNIPNLTGNANVGVGTSSSLYVRGLGNAESIATFDLPVGTYVDDVYISRQNHNNFSLFDVERIEVLRGPQGTLFGRNTTGGAINVVMKKPAEHRKAFVEAGIGRFGLWQVRGSADLPVSDRFLTKFSFYKVKDDGYAKQLSTGIEFNDRDALGARVDLRYLPTENLTVDFIADYVKDRNTNFLNVLDANGNRVINNRLVQGALVGFFTGAKAALAPGNEAKTKDVTLNVNWQLGSNLSLQSITGWRKTNHDFLVDSGGDAPRPSTIRGFTPLANMGDHKQVSQEFKFTGVNLDSRLNWVAGLYYMQERNVTDFGSSNGNLVAGGPTLAADRTMWNNLDAYAAYGQADYKLNGRWTLTAGLRYTDEKKDFAIERNAGAGGAALSTAAIAATGTPLELRNKVTTPRYAISYQLSDDVMLFASRTRGFKSGGWPARAVANTAFAPFKPEKIWSNEIGFRAELFEKSLRMNVTYFRSITDDVQIPARIDFNGLQISTTTNPAALTNHGLEIDADWAPTRNFSFNAGLGWQHAAYEKISAPVLNQAAACRAGGPTALFNGAPACNANFVDFFGNIARPVRAPDYTISLSATYHAHLGSIVLSPTFGYNFSAEYAISTTGTPDNLLASSTNPAAAATVQSALLTWSKAQAYINAGLALEFNNLPGLRISAECRNCADKAYPMSALGIFQFLDRPGTWSLNARYKF
jgi:iron complex outermembrane receptor protein